MTDIGTDILLERPYLFEVGGERFAIYPPSLGVLSLMQIRLRKLNISQQALEKVGNLEIYRVAKTQKNECCELIAMATCRTREDVLDVNETARRAELFNKCFDDEDVATMLVTVLQFNRHQQWMEEAGITKEHDRMAKVMRYKEVGNSVTFGGKTMYGQIIDPAMNRYGWTFDYTVWGVSFAVLEILLADRVNDTILTDDEKKKVPKHLLETEEAISGDDPRNYAKMQAIMNMT